MSTIADVPYATGAEIGGRWIAGLRRLPTEDELPYSDGIPVETPWHRDAATLLLETVRYHSRDRSDWWCAADIFLYFNLEMLKTKDFRGPDFFFVKGVSKRRRKSYVVWEEGGHFPNVIVELVSPSTRDADFGEKKTIYETVFQTPEYFIVDLDTAEIFGWRLVEGAYREIEPVDGKYRCEQLGLDLGMTDSTILYERSEDESPRRLPRFFYYDGRLAPTIADAERQKAEAERQKAEAATEKLSEAEARNAALLAALRAAQKS